MTSLLVLSIATVLVPIASSHLAPRHASHDVLLLLGCIIGGLSVLDLDKPVGCAIVVGSPPPPRRGWGAQ